MASIKKYSTKNGTRWRVQYRSPDGKLRGKRGFTTKTAAQAWVSQTEVDISHGTWRSPDKPVPTVGELVERVFVVSTEWKPSWRTRLDSIARVHVLPRWSSVPVTMVKQSEIREWLAELCTADGRKPLSGSSKRHCLTVLSSALDLAVADGEITSNPARGFPLPRKARPPQRFLTEVEVAALAARSRHPDVVWVLATTGMRFGELAGLQVRDVDFTAQRIQIVRNAVLVDGTIVVGTPKTGERRTITAPCFVFDMIKKRCQRKLPTAWIFSDTAEPLKRPGGGKWFDSAVDKCMKAGVVSQRVTLHDLRHTAASLMVASGANVKVVQRQLGHASAAMTLDTYASLFDDDLDGLRVNMDVAFANVVKM